MTHPAVAAQNSSWPAASTRAPAPRPPALDAYGLRPPDVEEVRAAVYRVSPHTADAVWAALMQSAGRSSADTDGDTVLRLIAAMQAFDDPVIALCARAISIRLASYQHLAATQHIVRNAP